jgi:molecular chaperone HtpG
VLELAESLRYVSACDAGKLPVRLGPYSFGTAGETVMATAPTVESFHFQAETTQLLHLMIHSLYTQREIFLRELISNASDALDRLRFEALTHTELVHTDHRYEILLRPDLSARTLIISDTGIGMSRQELIDNIGTIARSGTNELRTRVQGLQSTEAVGELIGQFGVGFYSAFMVSDRVRIITRRAGEAAAVCWDSTGDGSYTLTETQKAACGTEITLYLKQPNTENGIEDYTDRWKLAMIVHKYSDFIAYPIIYEGPAQEPGVLEDGVKEIKIETKTLNSMKPIWARNRSEVTEEDYNGFYRHVFNVRTRGAAVYSFTGILRPFLRCRGGRPQTLRQTRHDNGKMRRPASSLSALHQRCGGFL